MAETSIGHGTKRPEHLRFIRSLPCCICGTHPVEAAHVRMNDHATGKMQALGQKPDDKWSVPLCAAHHREGAGAQHQIGEIAFWGRHQIDPLKLSAMLFENSGDHAKGSSIALQARRFACRT